MADTTTQSLDLETRAEAVSIGGEAKYWQGQLDLADQDHREWIREGKDVVRRYKNVQNKPVRSGSKRFNVLYSNTETLKAALFARMAKPDIRRRFSDRDAVGRQVAEVIERSTIYCDDIVGSDKVFESAIEDYLLPGRGVVKVCYAAGTGAGDDGKERVTSQELYDEHVCWDDFRHEPARKWEKVTWIAFRHLMNRKALKDNGFTDPDKIPLNWSPKADDERVPDAYKRAEVWEIWDKETKTRVWIVKGFPKPCRKDNDPYGLEDFFPIAEPIQAITCNDTLIPRPEFSSYEDQADGLDEIEARIDRLTRALKRRGVYDASVAELKRLAKAADNEFIPVKNYADLSAKGGLEAAFQSEDISAIATVLTELHSQRDLRLQTIYEVVGIADIMRGSSDPRETLGAQKIKAQFGGNRLKKRQDKVQKWIRDTLRIKAEIIAEHFEPEKLAEMTGLKWQPAPPIMQAMPPGIPMGMPPGMPPGGQPGTPQPKYGRLQQPSETEGLLTPEMMQIMRSDKLRSYRVDIETDSTIFEDAEAEKAGRVELLKSISEFVTAWFPIIQAQPQLLPLAFELLSFGVRGFKAGRTLEESIDQAQTQLEDAAKQAAMQPPPKDPKVALEEAKLAAVQQKAQIDAKAQQDKAVLEQQQAQQEMAMRQQEMQAELQFLYQKLGFEREKMQMEAQAHQQDMAMQQQASEQDFAIKQREGEMQLQNSERQSELDAEGMEQKHEMGLEMMAAKAKQAKAQPKRPNA